MVEKFRGILKNAFFERFYLYKKNVQAVITSAFERFICDPAGTRTQDPIIKSDVLYQLSYEIPYYFLKTISYF